MFMSPFLYNPTGIVLLVILWRIGHMWQKQQEHGGEIWTKFFLHLLLLLVTFGQRSWCPKPTDYVTRAPILTRRGRKREVVVEVWPRDPLVVKGFSTIFCFFSVWTKILGITSNINTGHFRRLYKTNTKKETKISTRQRQRSPWAHARWWRHGEERRADNCSCPRPPKTPEKYTRYTNVVMTIMVQKPDKESVAMIMVTISMLMKTKTLLR